jgi:hypothetical protein
MDIRSPEELDAAVRLQRLQKTQRLLKRARRRGSLWRALLLLPLALAPVLLVSFGRQQPAFNMGVAMLFLVVGLGNLLVADRIDTLLELLEVRGLLDDR